MCNGISGASAPMASLASTSTTTGSGGSSLVAGTSGGGDTLPVIPADLATSLAQAQQAIEALSAAIPSLIGGGTLPTGEMPVLAPGAQPELPPDITGGGAPGQMPGQTPGQTPAQHAHGAGKDGKGDKAGKKDKKGGHGRHDTERTAPEDPAKAQKYLDATTSFFKDIKRSELTFGKGNTHGKLTAKQRAAFEKQFPGLDAPTAVVFPKKGGAPIGVVYSKAKEKNFDLGMGSMHTHGSSKNTMQHVWFTPGNLEFAFSDQSKGGAKKALQMIQGGGAPQKK